MATATYDRLTRSDMSGFDKECIDLAMEAVDFGWTGKMSSKGHLILRAPDGTTTMSISRRWTNGRSGLNMRSNFDRWLRSEQSDGISFEQFSDAWDAAEQERFVATMIAGLTEAANEFGSDDAERTKVIYRNILESPKVAPFAYRVGIAESRIKDFGLLIGYSDDIADEAKRPWNVNWAVYDARSMEVIDHGGPRLMDGMPWDDETISLLVVEKIRREREEAEPVVAVVEPVVEEYRPFACEWCDRTFKNNTNLGRHKSTIHRALWIGETALDGLEFKGDPEEDSLDDLMESNPIGPVAVQMDDHLTIVVDPHTGESEADFDDDGNRLTPAEVEMDAAQYTADMMGEAIDRLGIVAQRMAFLENERGEYEARIAAIQSECDEKIATLTKERDNARQSVDALKSLVADL